MSGSITRADTLTQTQKIPVIYSDLLSDFSPHPLVGDVAIAKNADAIKQSLRNLILTTLGERMFQPTVGSNTVKSLFDMNDQITSQDLQHYITETVQNNEPRVQLISVTATPTADTNNMAITIEFSIINTNTIQTLQFILQRVR